MSEEFVHDEDYNVYLVKDSGSLRKLTKKDLYEIVMAWVLQQDSEEFTVYNKDVPMFEVRVINYPEDARET
jgi:hypothetical protein